MRSTMRTVLGNRDIEKFKQGVYPKQNKTAAKLDELLTPIEYKDAISLGNFNDNF